MAKYTEGGFLEPDEVDFYTDLAMNESQRWIESATRERFLDEDDFLYSLRHGTQLRKILKKILPGFTDFSLTTKQRRNCTSDTGSETSSEQHSEYEEDWVHKFLRVCHVELGLERNCLFWPEDLVADLDEVGREGRFPPETLQKIRRVVTTVYELATELENRVTAGPKFDSTALEPLVKYHYWLCESGQEPLEKHPWFAAEAQLQNSNLHKDVKKSINRLLDNVCKNCAAEEHFPIVPCSSTTSGFSGDEIFDFPVCMDASVTEKVHKYLADLPEDQLSEGTGDLFAGIYSHSNRSSSPGGDFHHHQSILGGRQEKIPTRHFKMANPAPHDPLKFVAVSGATNLAESAKEKIRLAEQSKKIKEASIDVKFKEDEESEWVDNLDQWKKKRIKSLSVGILRTKEETSGPEEGIGGKTLDAHQQRRVSLPASSVVTEDNSVFSSPSFVGRELEQREEKRSEVDVRGKDHLHLAGRSVQQFQTMESTGEESVVEHSRIDYTTGKFPVSSMEDSGHFENETEELEQISPRSQNSTGSLERKRGVERQPEENDIPPPIRSEPPKSSHSSRPSVYDKLRPFTEPGVDRLQRNPQSAGLEYLTRYQEEMEVVDSGIELNRGSASPSRDSRESLSPRSPMSAENGHYYTRDYSNERTKSPVFVPPLPTSRPRPLVGTEHLSEKAESKWRYQEKDVRKTYQDLTVTLETKPGSEKGFGFTVKGAKDRRDPVKVEGVILGGAADKVRLQVGDEVLFINGEDVSNKLLPKVNMMIRESQRLGEIELVVRRTHYGGSPTLLEKSPIRRSPSPRAKATFDEKRSVFSNSNSQSDDGFLRFKKNRRFSSDYPKSAPPVMKSFTLPTSRQVWRRESADEPVNSARNLVRSSPILERRRQPGKIENFVPEVERSGDDSGSGSRSPGFDYRVTTLQRKRSPGRILDFVPENERKMPEASTAPTEVETEEQDVHWRREKEYIMSTRGGVNKGESEKVYYLRPSSRSSSSSSAGRSRSEYIKSPSPVRNYSIDGPVSTGRLLVNTHSAFSDNSNHDTGSGSSHLSPASSQLTSSSVAEKTLDDNITKEEQEKFDAPTERPPSPPKEEIHVTVDQEAEKFIEAKLQRIEQTRKIQTFLSEARASFLGLPAESSRVSNSEIDNFDCNNYLRWDTEKELFNRAIEILNTPAERYDLEQTERGFFGLGMSHSTEHVTEMMPLSQERPVSAGSEPKDNFGPILIKPIPRPRMSILVVPVRNIPSVEGSVHESILRAEEESEPDVIPVTAHTPIEGETEAPEEKMMAPRPFSHVKKDIIFSSEPVPGEPRPSTAYYPPLSQQLKKTKEREVVSPAYQAPLPRAVSPPLTEQQDIQLPTEERHGHVASFQDTTELQYMNLAAQSESPKKAPGEERHSLPHPMPRMRVETQDHWLVQEAEDLRLSDQLKQGSQLRMQEVNGDYENLPYHSPPEAERPPLPPSQPPPPPPTEPSEQDQVVSVSGRQKCSHCSEELGRGAAMIIESLNLFYHLGCFRCYVCSVALGNGAQGADVRIRAGKLHCQSCYSNDEVGLKFSEV